LGLLDELGGGLRWHSRGPRGRKRGVKQKTISGRKISVFSLNFENDTNNCMTMLIGFGFDIQSSEKYVESQNDEFFDSGNHQEKRQVFIYPPVQRGVLRSPYPETIMSPLLYFDDGRLPIEENTSPTRQHTPL
jgi:hypothetical protein